jgi:hypothetical protein
MLIEVRSGYPRSSSEAKAQVLLTNTLSSFSANTSLSRMNSTSCPKSLTHKLTAPADAVRQGKLAAARKRTLVFPNSIESLIRSYRLGG